MSVGPTTRTWTVSADAGAREHRLDDHAAGRVDGPEERRRRERGVRGGQRMAAVEQHARRLRVGEVRAVDRPLAEGAGVGLRRSRDRDRLARPEVRVVLERLRQRPAGRAVHVGGADRDCGRAGEGQQDRRAVDGGQRVGAGQGDGDRRARPRRGAVEQPLLEVLRVDLVRRGHRDGRAVRGARVGQRPPGSIRPRRRSCRAARR